LKHAHLMHPNVDGRKSGWKGPPGSVPAPPRHAAPFPCSKHLPPSLWTTFQHQAWAHQARPSPFSTKTPKLAQVTPAVSKRDEHVVPTSGRVGYAPEHVEHASQALEPLGNVPLTPGHVDNASHILKHDKRVPPTSGHVGYAPECVKHIPTPTEPLEIVPPTPGHVDNAPLVSKHVPQVQHNSNSAHTPFYTTLTPLSTSQVDADAQEHVMHNTQAPEPADDALDCVPHPSSNL